MTNEQDYPIQVLGQDQADLVQEAFDDIETATNIPVARGGLSLTPWEEDFVESIREQFEEQGRLSPKQFDVLQSIWDRT